MPTVSATWSPRFPSGEVSLKITNQSDEPIRISLHLDVFFHERGGAMIPDSEPSSVLDKTLIKPSVEFIISRGQTIGLEQRGPIARPVVIAPNETKTLKLDVPAGIVDLAHVSDEVVFRLKLGDHVISLTDLKSFQK